MASMPLSLFTPTSCESMQALTRWLFAGMTDSAQDRKSALLGQPVPRGLHHRPDVLVDIVDVGVFTEARGDVDRFEDLGDHLRRQRKVWRKDHAQPERETDADRQDVHARLGDSQFL